jgi:hypothetical protein
LSYRVSRKSAGSATTLVGEHRSRRPSTANGTLPVDMMTKYWSIMKKNINCDQTTAKKKKKRNLMIMVSTGKGNELGARICKQLNENRFLSESIVNKKKRGGIMHSNSPICRSFIGLKLLTPFACATSFHHTYHEEALRHSHQPVESTAKESLPAVHKLVHSFS